MSTALAWRIFDLGLRPWMNRRVTVHLAGVARELAEDRPVVLVANHESFWDGFLLRRVQLALRPAASFHAVMLEEELRRRPFLRSLGAFGIRPGSVASGRRLLQRIGDLDRSAVLGFFPQGRIWPGRRGPLRFRTGIARIVRAVEPATVVPVGLRLVSGRTPRTEAYVSVGKPIPSPGPDPVGAAFLEMTVAAELSAIDTFLSNHGEDAPERWPGPDGRLPRPVSLPGWTPSEPGLWLSRN